METFGPPMPFVTNDRFAEQRRATGRSLNDADIDTPITGLIAAINRPTHCFTLQSCFGHFVWPPDRGPHNLEPLPALDPGLPIEYRIAYTAICLDNGIEGRTLFHDLRALVEIDPEYVQFGSAGWFWEQQVNSYVLQVEPLRFRYQDQAILVFEEARRVEHVRDRFFEVLGGLFE
jgi:hypothetical protein